MACAVAIGTKGDQVSFSIVTQSAPPLNVMDLETFHAPTRLAPPPVSLQDFTAESPIRLRIKSQAGPLGAHPRQSVTCTSSRSCFFSAFGRPITSRVRQGNRAS